MKGRKMGLTGAGVSGSIKALKSAVKKGGGGTFIKSLADGEEFDIRFLNESPVDWFAYFEHYNKAEGFFPCNDDVCPGCDADNKASRKWLAAGLDVADSNKIIVMKLSKTMVDQLVKFYEKYGEINDRDYSLSREGTGMEDTKYMAVPNSPRGIPDSKWQEYVRQIPNYEKILLAQLGQGEDDDTDDDDPPPARTKRRPVAAENRSRRRSAPVDDDPDDDPPARTPRRPVRGIQRHEPPSSVGSTKLPRPGAARAAKEREIERQRIERETPTTSRPVRRKK